MSAADSMLRPQVGTLTTKPLNNPANNYTTNLPFTKTTDSFDIKSDFEHH